MTLFRFMTNLVKPLLLSLYRLQIDGDRRLPEGETLIVASNHIHNFDPVVLAIVFKNRDIHFMAKKELFKPRPLGWLFEKIGTIPVDRNKSDITAIKKAIKILKSNKVLGIFPQGTRIKSEEDDTSKAGLGMFAIKTDAKIIPVRIESSYKIFSKIKVTILDAYKVPEDLKVASPDNYMEVARQVMSKIKDN